MNCYVMRLTLAILLTTVPVISSAQDCVPNVDLKKIAKEAKELLNDDNAVMKAIDTAVGIDGSFAFRHQFINLSSDDKLSAVIVLPYMAYRRGVMEALRKREPVEAVELPRGVEILISPNQLDSPDIIKVIVSRDGHDVTPIASTLAPKELSTRMGAKAVLHAGSLVFPCSAFQPGGTVRVTLIPESGSNTDLVVPRSELAIFSTKYADIVATSLLKKTAADVEALLGKARQVDGKRWTYIAGAERLQVYFDSADVVVDVQPPTFDLTALKRQ